MITSTKPATPRTWSRRTSFRLAVATQILVLAASNFPTPLFPIYAQRYHFGAATVTLLFSVYVAALIPAMLTLGRITDRVGRRPALVGGMAITAISSVAFAAARNVGWLFAGEIIYGIAAGLVMSATTVTIRELHPKQHAGSGALAAMAAVAAGLTLGPLVSGALATVTSGPTVTPFLLDIVLSIALALALWRIPETRPAHTAAGARPPVLHVPPSIRRTWAATTLASASGWMFMGWILGLSPSFLHEQLGIEISQPIVAGLFAGGVVFTNGLTQILLRRHHEKAAMLRLGIALIPIGLAVFALSPRIGGLAAALAGGIIGGIGGGIVQPNTMATIQSIAPDHARGGVTSAYLSVSYLAMSVPVVVAGLAASVIRVNLATVAIWYLAATAVVALVAVVASLATARRQEPVKDVYETLDYAPGSTELVASNPKANGGIASRAAAAAARGRHDDPHHESRQWP
jgi:MFS family permease